jgi:hypothetical protein
MATENETAIPTPIPGSGLTPRQQYAAVALGALISKPQPVIGSSPVADSLATAKTAWAYADAMIKTEGPAPVPPPA